MGKVVHFEIPFDDKKRAMKFYADALDWKLTDMAEMSYVMAETAPVGDNRLPKEPGAINGGLFQRPQEAPHTVVYVGVESIDAALKKVASRGRQGRDAEDAHPRHGRVRSRHRHRGERRRAVRDRLSAGLASAACGRLAHAADGE